MIFFCMFVCFVFGHASWLVPWPGIEPMSPAVKAQSLNHWTTREVPKAYALNHYNILKNTKNPKIESMMPALFRSRLLQGVTRRSYEITWQKIPTDLVLRWMIGQNFLLTFSGCSLHFTVSTIGKQQRPLAYLWVLYVGLYWGPDTST